MTEIDGLDISFHPRSFDHEKALRSSSRTGARSIIEQLKIIGPLANPRHMVERRKTLLM